MCVESLDKKDLAQNRNNLIAIHNGTNAKYRHELEHDLY